MSIITYNIKLETECQDHYDLLHSTLLEHQKVWNHISTFVFNNKCFDKKLIHDKNYHNCRSIFPDAPSQIIIRAKDSVYATYKTIIKNHQFDIMTEPANQTNLSLRLDKRLYTFLPDNKIKLTTTDKRVICSYNPYDKFSELLSKFTLCDPLIFMRDNQLWLAVSFDVPNPVLIENSCIGVDLGINRPFTTSEGISIKDKKFLKEKRQLRYLKRVLNSKYKTTKSGSAKKKLEHLKRKEHNKNKNQTHLMVNHILKTKSNVIVIEDLSNIKQSTKMSKRFNNKHSQVSYHFLKQILSYKALLIGKEVVTVDPAYTSKNDYRQVERGIRKGCRYYATDGKVFDADWNAAINIANRYANAKIRKGVDLPVSFSEPLDGKLNFIGKPYHLANSEIRSHKPNDL